MARSEKFHKIYFIEMESVIRGYHVYKTMWTRRLERNYKISKCALVSLKNGKGVRSEGIKLSNGEKIGEPDANWYINM